MFHPVPVLIKGLLGISQPSFLFLISKDNMKYQYQCNAAGKDTETLC